MNEKKHRKEVFHRPKKNEIRKMKSTKRNNNKNNNNQKKKGGINLCQSQKARAAGPQKTAQTIRPAVAETTTHPKNN